MGAVGVPINVFALCYLVFSALWMPFPQMLPVTGDNMNYAGPIFGAVVLGAVAHWLISGKNTFKMPIIQYE
jgi:choline transport protein